MTLRLRLTLLYGACFLAAGTALLAITYGLVAGDPVVNSAQFAVRGARVGLAVPAFGPVVGAGAAVIPSPAAGTLRDRTVQAGPPVGFPLALQTEVSQLRTTSQKEIDKVVSRARQALDRQRQASLNSLLTRSGVALGIMAVLSIGLGWLVAGRALRPLRTMSRRAREITADSLHERLGLDGRRDELGQLAGTFDGLLARLERAFEAQRRFVANASHELRTPITLERAVLEVALADPDASADSLRDACARVLASNAQQERLIDGLLTLARGQAGAGPGSSVDLGQVAAELSTLREHETPLLRWDLALDPAVVRGDPILLERLIANLVDNAVAYNVASGGWVSVVTGSGPDGSYLTVANAGTAIAPERVPELFEPFRRLDGERLANGHGAGLGLSIVRAIADASGAGVAAEARPDGGLVVTVRFPPAPEPAPEPVAATSSAPGSSSPTATAGVG